MSDICMYFHLSVCTWWCGRLFSSSLHTIILHMFAHLIDHLTHHYSSQFSSCRWWCRKFFFFFFFLHTTICTCHSISLIHIHHNFHPIVRCSFMCTKLSAPISKGGVRFTEHQPSPVFLNLLISILHSPKDLSAVKIGFITSYYIYVTLLVCTCH